MLLAQVTSLSVLLVLLSLVENSTQQFWKNDKIVKQWQTADQDNGKSASSFSSSQYQPQQQQQQQQQAQPVNSGLGSLIASFADPSVHVKESPKDDYAKTYAPSAGASSYDSAPSQKLQPQPNYAPAYPSYEYKYPSYPSYHESHEYKPAPSYKPESHEYKPAPSYNHESYEYKPAPSYKPDSHEYKPAPSYSKPDSHEYKPAPPAYNKPDSHEYKPSYESSHEYNKYPAVLPPSVLPQGAYPIHQPTITNTGETIIENLVGGIPFDCRGRSTGHWRDTKYCDIFHACVFGIQRKTYVCPYVGERTYYDEGTRRCEFVYRNPHGCGSNSYYH